MDMSNSWYIPPPVKIIHRAMIDKRMSRTSIRAKNILPSSVIIGRIVLKNGRSNQRLEFEIPLNGQLHITNAMH
jgi:hypothetical protein